MDVPPKEYNPQPVKQVHVVHHERHLLWLQRLFATIITIVVWRLQLFILADQLDKSDTTMRGTPCLIIAAVEVWREDKDYNQDWPQSLLGCYVIRDMLDIASTAVVPFLMITGACMQFRWWKKIWDDSMRIWTTSWVILTWLVLVFYGLPMLIDGRLAGVFERRPVCDIWKILSILSAEGSIGGEHFQEVYRRAKWSPLFHGCARWTWGDLFKSFVYQNRHNGHGVP